MSTTLNWFYTEIGRPRRLDTDHTSRVSGGKRVLPRPRVDDNCGRYKGLGSLLGHVASRYLRTFYLSTGVHQGVRRDRRVRPGVWVHTTSGSGRGPGPSRGGGGVVPPRLCLRVSSPTTLLPCSGEYLARDVTVCGGGGTRER